MFEKTNYIEMCEKEWEEILQSTFPLQMGQKKQ